MGASSSAARGGDGSGAHGTGDAVHVRGKGEFAWWSIDRVRLAFERARAMMNHNASHPGPRPQLSRLLMAGLATPLAVAVAGEGGMGRAPAQQQDSTGPDGGSGDAGVPAVSVTCPQPSSSGRSGGTKPSTPQHRTPSRSPTSVSSASRSNAPVEPSRDGGSHPGQTDAATHASRVQQRGGGRVRTRARVTIPPRAGGGVQWKQELVPVVLRDQDGRSLFTRQQFWEVMTDYEQMKDSSFLSLSMDVFSMFVLNDAVPTDTAEGGTPFIDIMQVLLVLALFCQGSLEKQLRLCFEMFDAGAFVVCGWTI